MDIKAVVGAGYGDEGKGLMTDYFCRNISGKVLNVKVNGGAQAGHTVCSLDNNGVYRHWVFSQYGSGTFSGADTYLLCDFIVNFDRLLEESKRLSSIYGVNTHLYIDKKCRVTLPVDIILNRFVETSRDKNRHGSCGLGIFETFNRNNKGYGLTLNDVIEHFLNKNTNSFEDYINNISNEYLTYRTEELKTKSNITISEGESKDIVSKFTEENKQFIDNFVDIIKMQNISFVNSLEELIRNENYKRIVFECSQGLELDQNNKRNWPNLTPSSTGLNNIINEIKRNNKLKWINDIEACFVTRSYKTKHGAGLFIEQDDTVQQTFGLYDRTNKPNEFQETLRYGTLNIGRLKNLIMEEIWNFRHSVKNNITVSACVTHLDQTNGFLLASSKNIPYKEVISENMLSTNKYYVSFGEKAQDILDTTL